MRFLCAVLAYLMFSLSADAESLSRDDVAQMVEETRQIAVSGPDAIASTSTMDFMIFKKDRIGQINAHYSLMQTADLEFEDLEYCRRYLAFTAEWFTYLVAKRLGARDPATFAKREAYAVASMATADQNCANVLKNGPATLSEPVDLVTKLQIEALLEESNSLVDETVAVLAFNTQEQLAAFKKNQLWPFNRRIHIAKQQPLEHKDLLACLIYFQTVSRGFDEVIRYKADQSSQAEFQQNIGQLNKELGAAGDSCVLVLQEIPG